MKSLLKSLLISLSMGLLLTPVVHADPPRWAPAYGYRYHHKQDQLYRYHHNNEYGYPYYNYRRHHNDGVDGVVFGTVLGTAVGGAIGSQAAENQAAGAITGMFVGAVVGNIIGRALDDGDRGRSRRYSRTIVTPYRTWHR